MRILKLNTLILFLFLFQPLVYGVEKQEFPTFSKSKRSSYSYQNAENTLNRIFSDNSIFVNFSKKLNRFYKKYYEDNELEEGFKSHQKSSWDYLLKQIESLSFFSSYIKKSSSFKRKNWKAITEFPHDEEKEWLQTALYNKYAPKGSFEHKTYEDYCFGKEKRGKRKIFFLDYFSMVDSIFSLMKRDENLPVPLKKDLQNLLTLEG